MRSIRSLAVAAIGLAVGCGRPAAAPVAVAPPAESKPVPAVATLVPAAPGIPQPPPARPAEPFRLPTDDGGRAVAAALAPAAPPAPPLPGAKGPRLRVSELDRGELPMPNVTVAVPRLPLPSAKPHWPTPPAERVPADVGRAVAENPATVKFSDRPAVRRTAAVDAAPADLPPLARPAPDRAPLDDPTAEIAAARVVLTTLPLPFHPGWFARFGIPDPFELADHLRGKTGLDRELATTPALIPPPRP